MMNVRQSPSPVLTGLDVASALIKTNALPLHQTANHLGEGRIGVSWGQPRLPFQESGVPGLPNFGGSVFMPATFKAERPNSAWEGAFYEASHAMLHLHKCVVRFVSDY